MKWLEKGITECVPEEEFNRFSHYLPHRPVIKAESTTKIRPVFDASACEKGFPSLNQCLEKGPNLIELIPDTLLRFREHDIGVVADIRKAFLQIEINQQERDYLRFFWFLDGKLSVFRHRRVVFGLTCSPFLLGAVLEYHFSNVLRDLEGRFCERWTKEIVKKLAKSFYVDNCTTSVRSEEELNCFIREGKEILSAGGFELRGWEFTHDSSEKDTTQVLGILFNKARDTISINPPILGDLADEKMSKRSILSVAHKIFDPIGFTCPVTLIPKLILQKLYKLKIDWDTPVDEEIKREILQWYEQLHILKKIEIPRKFGTGDFSLHTFCDASKVAYAAVTFLRVVKKNRIEVKFIAAKSRVAPQKVSIPRLELLAASIGARQTHAIRTVSDFKSIPTYFWSDSTTVLAWIKQDLQWGTFVWNRVREIRNLTSGDVWRYVPGDENPADLPSRGCQARQLLESRWWDGPAWLLGAYADWPRLTDGVDENEVRSELKRSVQISMLIAEEKTDFEVVEKFSSYSKLIRFFCIMLRFKNFLLKRKPETGNRITYQEICETELKFLKQLQKYMFQSKDPKLQNLQIFKHTDGLLRLKTRIFERDDYFPFLCPILLVRKHKVVELLIREAHEKMCHAGVQAVMCHLREKFWILSMRKAVKNVISKCVICKKHTVRPMKTNPPPLPIRRVNDAAVFEVTGVDFAGPVFLRGLQKGGICLFTCAVYRAIHLELVTSLSTKEFISCLRRFIGRRGRPSIMYSDNGRNFVGADNYFKELNWEVIEKYSSATRIDWRFNPPSAAWWGGWWERLIGMLKTILRKVLGRSCLSYEEMSTVLCDCESVLNSRPLTYISEEPDDLKTLTPAMFLNDIREIGTPDLDLIDKIDLNSRFVYRQRLMQHLRKRFRREYLSQLISRSNVKEVRKIKVGEIVLIGDDIHKRIDWPLARVEKLILGRDGTARVAVLKTKAGQFKRPIQRLYPLEISREDTCQKLYVDC